MKIIEDVALELLLIDAQIEFVNKALAPGSVVVALLTNAPPMFLHTTDK
jgi:hypothetical protein